MSLPVESVLLANVRRSGQNQGLTQSSRAGARDKL
jgi:hypothetical protein